MAAGAPPRSTPPPILLPRWTPAVAVPAAAVVAYLAAITIGQALLVFGVAGVVALVLNPIVRGLERMRVPLTLAVIIVVLALLGATFAAVVAVGAAAVGQVRAFERDTPAYAERAGASAQRLQDFLARRGVTATLAPMGFPTTRPRRTRMTPALRRLVRETAVAPDDLVQPLFAVDRAGARDEIASMPGQFHLSADDVIAEAAASAHAAGVGGVLLFGLPDPADKDARGSGADAADGVVQRAVRQIKAAAPDLVVIADLCLCEYTDHGHCGLLSPDGEVLNDATLERLAATAVSQARAGADVVAPSDMMDGRVGAIRAALDAAGFAATPICAYAAKYASAFYGPFRDAVASTPSHGDRRSHQLDPANGREALREVALDVEEGADLILVKPALPYLDIVRSVRDRFDLPLGAYVVSGEYAMLESAAAAGLLDRRLGVLEALTSVRRAGADLVISYHAAEAAGWLT